MFLLAGRIILLSLLWAQEWASARHQLSENSKRVVPPGTRQAEHQNGNQLISLDTWWNSVQCNPRNLAKMRRSSFCLGPSPQARCRRSETPPLSPWPGSACWQLHPPPQPHGVWVETKSKSSHSKTTSPSSATSSSISAVLCLSLKCFTK